MPNKFTTNDLIDAINAYSASDASENWVANVPEVTRENIDSTVRDIINYQTIYNEFTDVLLWKFFITLFRRGYWVNPLARFKMGYDEYGAWAEEIWVGDPKEEVFDPEGPDFATRRKPPVQVTYHRLNSQAKFVVTVSNEQANTAFQNGQGVANLVDAIIAGLYTQDNYTEFLKMKRIFAMYFTDPNVPDGSKVEIPDVVDQESALNFVTKLQQASLDMSFYTDKYNIRGVRDATSLDQQVLFISKDVFPLINTNLFGNTYNLPRVDYMVEPVIVDDFGITEVDEDGNILLPEGKTIAILAHRDWFRVWDKQYKLETFRNPSGMFTNYFLHHWAIYSCSPFRNVIRFYVAQDGVTP